MWASRPCINPTDGSLLFQDASSCSMMSVSDFPPVCISSSPASISPLQDVGSICCTPGPSSTTPDSSTCDVGIPSPLSPMYVDLSQPQSQVPLLGSSVLDASPSASPSISTPVPSSSQCLRQLTAGANISSTSLRLSKNDLRHRIICGAVPSDLESIDAMITSRDTLLSAAPALNTMVRSCDTPLSSVAPAPNYDG